MNWRNSWVPVFAMAATILLGSSRADAVLISYTDRTTFEGAAGSFIIEDFESFLVDTPFHTVPVDVGDFTVSMAGDPSTAYNFIDIAPPDTSETDVNGTTNMRVFTDSGDPSADLIFSFDTPITAFGADFRSLNDSIVRTQILVGFDVLALPVGASSGLFSFFGFTSDTPFTEIVFQGLANDVYGIDNVTYSAGDVPEPATIALLGLGFAGLGFVRRRSGKE